MKVGVMIGDLLRSLFRKPVTQQYPVVKIPAPERMRGKLFYNPEKCTGCMLCVKDCPSEAIELIVLDRVNKRFVMRYHVDRCTYCGQCVENCRFSCLGMSSTEWELASTKKEPFEVYYGRDEDIQALMDRLDLESGTPHNKKD